MTTFIRGPEPFVTAGQIYVKMLPDGQPAQLTHDKLPKMAPVFSPDGSRMESVGSLSPHTASWVQECFSYSDCILVVFIFIRKDISPDRPGKRNLIAELTFIERRTKLPGEIDVEWWTRLASFFANPFHLLALSLAYQKIWR